MAQVSEEDIKADIAEIVSGEQQLANLAADPAVQRFLQLQKKVSAASTILWETVQQQMVNNGVKSIKGPWGSVTVAERTSFSVNMEELPRKYTERAANMKLILSDYKLKGKAPKGTTPKTTMYLLKKIKLQEEIE